MARASGLSRSRMTLRTKPLEKMRVTLPRTTARLSAHGKDTFHGKVELPHETMSSPLRLDKRIKVDEDLVARRQRTESHLCVVNGSDGLMNRRPHDPRRVSRLAVRDQDGLSFARRSI